MWKARNKKQRGRREPLQLDEALEELNAALSDRYTIDRTIGRGGMATVFLAKERHPPRQVAVKVLDPALSGNIGRERFLREIEMVSRLTHPLIVPVFTAGEAAGLLYYVMPYIAGESLRGRLKGGKRLELDDALHVTFDVADALDYAHGLGIVHRDIKPENILLEVGHAVVTDFGIARALRDAVGSGEQLTLADRPVGTPGYMSPEQLSAAREVDGRSDVYSLAAVLYEMLSGARPFLGADPGAAANAKSGGTGGSSDLIPESIERVLRKALAWSPEDRYATAKLFVSALSSEGTAHTLHTAHPSTPTPPEEVPRKSIAVLPFTNMSNDPENEYFSDGITDDIINQLSKVGDLKVTSRTSVMRYKSAEKDLRQIGGELGVANVLEGSVRRSGQRVRVVSQLIDVQTDAHLWAETYDRDLTDIFEIQSDVAQQIAGALEATLSPRVKESICRKPTTNLEAYNLYLQGVYHWNQFKAESAERALQFFRDALERDPNFAAGHAGMGNAYLILALGAAQGPLSPAEAFPRARAAAQQALAIDETLADAHATLGSILFWHEWDWVAAEAAFKRAQTVGCGCESELSLKYAFYLAAMGRHKEGIVLARKARSLDPGSLIVNSHLGDQLSWARKPDQAQAQLTKTLELNPDFPPALLSLGWSYLHTGEVDGAIEQFERVRQHAGKMGMWKTALGAAYAKAGRTDDANAILGELFEDRSSGEVYVSSHDIALAHAWQSEKQQALDWLERAYEEHDGWMPFINVDPWWDPLRSESRFKEIVEKMGLELSV
jgi:serine/threonine-protein kinase